MKDRGFLIGTDGPYNNVLKIKPPIIFSMYNAKKLIQKLEEVLTKLKILALLISLIGF
jgi:4-aminobutyrate aminotransferase-like enzyme